MGREYASMKTEDRIQIVSWLIKLIMETLTVLLVFLLSSTLHTYIHLKQSIYHLIVAMDHESLNCLADVSKRGCMRL